MNKKDVKRFNKRCRIQIDLKPNELELIESFARSRSCRASELAKEALLDFILNRATRGDEQKIDQLLAYVSERFGKLERIQRSILINTSVARSHATAVIEVGEKELASKLKTHMLDATDKQRAIYFDLYPEQKEAQS